MVQVTISCRRDPCCCSLWVEVTPKPHLPARGHSQAGQGGCDTEPCGKSPSWPAVTPCIDNSMWWHCGKHKHLPGILPKPPNTFSSRNFIRVWNLVSEGGNGSMDPASFLPQLFGECLMGINFSNREIAVVTVGCGGNIYTYIRTQTHIHIYILYILKLTSLKNTLNRSINRGLRKGTEKGRNAHKFSGFWTYMQGYVGVWCKHVEVTCSRWGNQGGRKVEVGFPRESFLGKMTVRCDSRFLMAWVCSNQCFHLYFTFIPLFQVYR